MVSVEEFANKGYTKAVAKDANIRKSWEAAKERCINNYASLPFGPTRKANHAAAVRAASFRTNWEKWKTNYIAKMKE
ncbi:MAG: hypothetical protein QXI12_05155 [Candidatus Methanomethyliaceae archaeon]